MQNLFYGILGHPICTSQMRFSQHCLLPPNSGSSSFLSVETLTIQQGPSLMAFLNQDILFVEVFVQLGVVIY
jgi:hypothetical protein